MQLGDIKSRVRTSLAEPSDLDAEILEWIQDALLEIHSEGRWPWDMKDGTVLSRGVLTTVTGTWDPAAGHGAAADQIVVVANEPVQAIADDYVGGLIRLSGAGNTYVISTWDVATNLITIEPGTTGIIDAAETAGTMEIAEDLISLPSNVASVDTVVDHLNFRPLNNRREAWARFWPDPFTFLGSEPVDWGTLGVDSSGNILMRLFPLPDADKIYYLLYHARPTVPVTATADTVEMEALTGIPQQFHKVIVARAIYESKKAEFERVTQIPEFGEFKDGIARMKKYAKSSHGKIEVLQSDRFRHNSRDLFRRFPNYYQVDI